MLVAPPLDDERTRTWVVSNDDPAHDAKLHIQVEVSRCAFRPWSGAANRPPIETTCTAAEVH